MYQDILRMLLLVVVVEAITEIMVSSKIMDPLRQRFFRLAFPFPRDDAEFRQRPVMAFIYGLISCGYCFSVWVGAVAAFMAPAWFTAEPVLNWSINALVLHRLSNIFHIVLMLTMKGRVRTYDVALTLKLEDSDGGSGQIGGQSADAAETK